MRKRIFIFIVALLTTSGVSANPEDIRARNVSNLKKLHVGMDRRGALEVMGAGSGKYIQRVYFEGYISGFKEIEVSNPYRYEQKEVDRGEVEIVFFFTSEIGLMVGFWDANYRDGKVSDAGLTPLVFKGDRLIGWDWELIEEVQVFKDVDEEYYWLYWGNGNGGH